MLIVVYHWKSLVLLVILLIRGIHHSAIEIMVSFTQDACWALLWETIAGKYSGVVCFIFFLRQIHGEVIVEIQLLEGLLCDVILVTARRYTIFFPIAGRRMHKWYPWSWKNTMFVAVAAVLLLVSIFSFKFLGLRTLNTLITLDAGAILFSVFSVKWFNRN